MKNQLKTLIRQSLSALITTGSLPEVSLPTIQIGHTKDKSHGDFACNIALMLARQVNMTPYKVATLIKDNLPNTDLVSGVEVANPGFINFTLSAEHRQQIINSILVKGDNFGFSKIGEGRSVHIESVSANPTGPLHIGHGRGAVYGSVVANLLTAVGFNVHREYYVNDAGRQMDILATSVWLRYLSICGENLVFPSNAYKGDYVVAIAKNLKEMYGEKLKRNAASVFNGVPPDEPQGGDKDKHIDALVLNTKRLLGKHYQPLLDKSLHFVLDDIRRDLTVLGVHYDEWFSERSLTKSAEIDKAIDHLKQADILYEKDKAWWFRSAKYGDEKDRVVIRNNGQITYFASDIAYHLNKFNRRFDRVINIWGSDHHGYVSRIKASLEAAGKDKNKLKILLVQFAVLYRGDKKIAMSTRSGEFVMLRELEKEVGKDAARFFYVLYGADQHMNFDLELAKAKNNDNPVYYVQYVHARISSVFKKLTQDDLTWRDTNRVKHLQRLTEDEEYALLKTLARYPEVIESAALNYAPHALARYLMDLAREFHVYYNAHQFITHDIELRQARLALIYAVRQVIRNGLNIIGVSTPDVM